jgi:hypothetical protein
MISILRYFEYEVSINLTVIDLDNDKKLYSKITF